MTLDARPDVRVRHARRPRRRRARRADRRRLAADLPDLDLRAGRRRAAARRLRVRAVAEPDPRAARARGRDARGRRGTGSHSRADRRRRRRSPSSRQPARRSSSATTSTAARSATSSGSIGRTASRRATPTSRPARTRSGRQLTARTRLVWFESPTNPYLQDHRHRRSVAATVRERAAQAGGVGPLVVVDNTFASPALQRPLELGADIVFHSATKYLAGHSDTVLGVAVTNDDAIAERLRFLQNAMGGVPGPLDCFLVLRGLRTLHLRVERHSRECGSRWRGSWPPRRRRPRRRTRASPTARTPTRAPQIAARQMRAGWRHGLVHPGGARATRRRASGRSRSARRRGCSRWPSRWAASSR